MRSIDDLEAKREELVSQIESVKGDVARLRENETDLSRIIFELQQEQQHYLEDFTWAQNRLEELELEHHRLTTTEEDFRSSIAQVQTLISSKTSGER